MSVSSHSSNLKRRAPQQDRSTRRVEAFLAAAEKLFAEQGFEAATMTQVAEDAGSSIGALYSYFPDKKALALALLDVHAAAMEGHWRPLFDDVAAMTAEEFADRFIDGFVDFVQEYPAYLQLQAAPIRLKRSAEAKRAFRASMVDGLQRRVPGWSVERVELSVGVILQLVRGMMQMYFEAPPAGKGAVITEFKVALGLYMETLFRA